MNEICAMHFFSIK